VRLHRLGLSEGQHLPIPAKLLVSSGQRAQSAEQLSRWRGPLLAR